MRDTHVATRVKPCTTRPQEFNAKTANYKEGTLLRVKVRVFSDKSYEWDLKTPPSTWLIKKAAGAVLVLFARLTESPLPALPAVTSPASDRVPADWLR